MDFATSRIWDSSGGEESERERVRGRKETEMMRIKKKKCAIILFFGVKKMKNGMQEVRARIGYK